MKSQAEVIPRSGNASCEPARSVEKFLGRFVHITGRLSFSVSTFEVDILRAFIRHSESAYISCSAPLALADVLIQKTVPFQEEDTEQYN